MQTPIGKTKKLCQSFSKFPAMLEELYFLSTEAAAAELGALIHAIVSRGGMPDLAQSALSEVISFTPSLSAVWIVK